MRVLGISPLDKICYPFLAAKNERNLYMENLEEEKAFVKFFQPPDPSGAFQEVEEKVAGRSEPIQGLREPNLMHQRR